MRNTLVTVLSWNHLSFTKLCLKYLWKNTDPKNTILVIDNGSNEETLEWLRNAKDTYAIELIENGQNLGIAGSINIGMKISLERDMDFCFFSNDVVAGAKWLENLQEETYKYDCAMSSPYIGPEATYDEFINMEFRQKYRQSVWPKLKNDPSVGELESIIDELHGGSFQDFTENWAETRKDVPPLYEIFSMVMYIKNETIKKVGLFDPQFFPSHYEDLDYMCRLNNYGLKRIGCSSSYCFHFSTITTRAEFGDGDPNLRAQANDSERKFNLKWKIFLPYEQRRNDVPDGDKYPYMGKEVSFLPFEVSDSKNNRHHNRWRLWEPEKYPNIPQLGRDYEE